MGCRSLLLYSFVVMFLAICGYKAQAYTDPLDVISLQDLYKSLNNPPQLKEWKLDGGDPCEESWTGISCSGSSVIYIKLDGLELNGYIGGLLFNLHNLKFLDVSLNNIQGEIPHGLPPNATHINLACNAFIQNIPHSLTSLMHLKYLNLSHNSLSGPIGNVFTGLENLKEMDLSYNKFSGDLPSSFGSLSNLTQLFLQNNDFTGSVIYLANLPLLDLNIQDNNFSGVIPRQFESISNLWIGGNKFQTGENYPPWNFPMDNNIPIEKNISSRPTTESSAIETYPSLKTGRHKKNLGPGGIAFLVGGGALLVSCAILVVIVHISRSRSRRIGSLASNDSSMHSFPSSTARDYSSATLEEFPPILTLTPPAATPSRIHPVEQIRTGSISKRRSFSMNRTPAIAKLYTVAELQSATNYFSEENLLGEGSLGCVYKAELVDGQIMVVKHINTTALSMQEEDQLMDVIWFASCLRHPNIVPLIGYCFENGQHFLVYEYVRNLSLDDALHCKTYKPLSWALRLRIAVDVARALNYLHSSFTPPAAHCNLKAANILLDEDLLPHITDCGLAILRPLTSNSAKLKASEMAISNVGYIAPEKGQHGVDNTKSDTYAFGVLLLEMLTGRRPHESSRPTEEQSLVKWASSQLHDYESLEQMVDLSIKRTLSSKILSRLADIISLCIQPEKEFRPPMCEIVECLRRLLQKSGNLKCSSVDGTEVDPFERSFRSTHTRFLASPTASFFSV